VISEDFAFFGFDEASWDRLASLLLGDREPSGVLVVVVNRAAVPVACFHTERGSIDPSLLPSPGDLEALCQTGEARACIIMRARAMEEVESYLGEPLDPDEALASRVLRFARVLRELGNGNWLRVWPNPLPSLLLAAAPAAKSAKDHLLPDGHSIALGIFEHGELWTGAVLRRRRDEIDLLAGPQAIAEWAGPLGGEWRRDHRVLADAIEREVGPVHLGLFMERPTAERLLGGRQGGDWALAFATRELVAHPLPGFAAAGLGLDLFRGTAQLAMQVVEGIDPDEIASIARRFWKGFTEGKP
jgi:hypothetical protein